MDALLVAGLVLAASLLLAAFIRLEWTREDDDEGAADRWPNDIADLEDDEAIQLRPTTKRWSR